MEPLVSVFEVDDVVGNVVAEVEVVGGSVAVVASVEVEVDVDVLGGAVDDDVVDVDVLVVDVVVTAADVVVATEQGTAKRAVVGNPSTTTLC